MGTMQNDTMVLKSQIDYQCPQCQLAWLPFASGLKCPSCSRAVPDTEVTGIVAETLESARFNKRLYGRYELEYWITRLLGDRYMAWGFKTLQLTEAQPGSTPDKIAMAALLDIDLEELAPHRTHVMAFLTALIIAYHEAIARSPDDWQKMPEPETREAAKASRRPQARAR